MRIVLFLPKKVMSRKRRNRLTILAEILTITKKEGVLQTHIMYGANLSMKQTYEYLDFLLKKKLLKKVGKSYKTTEKGIRYLQTLEEVYTILDMF